MKIICAPDSFKGSIGAAAAAEAIAVGVRRAAPHAFVDLCPIADGGEGTLDAVQASLPCDRRQVEVSGSQGDPVIAEFGLFHDGGTALVESAGAVGLTLLPPGRRDIMRASSRGVGEMLLAACECGPQRVIVGVGGSATNDGGCGMAQALGVRFLDDAGAEITEPIGGGMLPRINRIDMRALAPAVKDIPVIVACDVTNPLTGPDGASRVYGPQKGGTREQVRQLDDALVHLSGLLRRDLGLDVERIPGAGAAGGLGAGLLAFAGASIQSGIDIVLDLVGFDERVTECDLCLTGEGRLDEQSLSGKACIGVAGHAAMHGVPTVALVGAVGPGAERTLDAGLEDYVVFGTGLPSADSIARAAELLAAAAESVTRRYS